MEEAVHFVCGGKRLYGVLHLPDPGTVPSTVVVMLAGGPQVRAGAHRLYVQLSRFLAEHGWASLRFDYEGMGDSEGDYRGFQHAGPSIAAAMDFLRRRFGKKLKFVFWSLCDGATAAALYGAGSPESIGAMILCNPLVITDEGLARSTIRHYYRKRLFEKEFLQKLLRFELDLADTITSLWESFRGAQFLRRGKSAGPAPIEQTLPDLVFNSLHSFPNPVRIILSTDDIVASNFRDELKKNEVLKKDCQRKKIINHVINGADHTFVDPAARKELFAITLKALDEAGSPNSEKGHGPT